MRAITDITIRTEEEGVTMFLTYNNDSSDYSFSSYTCLEDAFEAIRAINDPYFPIKTNTVTIRYFKSKDKVVDLQAY